MKFKFLISIIFILILSGMSAAGMITTSTLENQIFFLEPKDSGGTARIYYDLNTSFGIDFKKTPEDMKSGKIYYHILKPGTDESHSVPMAWNKDKGLLYIDVNGNMDITDDPGNRHESSERGRPNYANFNNVTIPVIINDETVDYNCNFTFYDYNRGFSRFYVFVQNSWSEDIILGNEKVTLTISDNLDGELKKDKSEYNTDRFSIYFNNENFEGNPVIFSDLSFSDSLYLRDTAWNVKYEFVPLDNDVYLKATFEKKSPETASINLPGKYIRQIQFDGTWFALYPRPPEKITIPAGSYPERKVVLQKAGSDKSALSDDSGRISTFDPGTSITLKTGGPLSPMINYQQDSSRITFSYQLKGIGGETYSPVNIDYSSPPRLEIYSGDELIQSAAFQFG